MGPVSPGGIQINLARLAQGKVYTLPYQVA